MRDLWAGEARPLSRRSWPFGVAGTAAVRAVSLGVVRKLRRRRGGGGAVSIESSKHPSERTVEGPLNAEPDGTATHEGGADGLVPHAGVKHFYTCVR